jgi:Ca2+-transporting ATPase
LANILGYEYRSVRKANDHNIIQAIPFSSETKTMSTVVKDKGNVVVYTKGAPDFLLQNCGFYLDAAGNEVKITEAFKNTLLSKLNEFAEATLRTLLLAYK